ncbi:MAG TPA: zinc-ribbon domain-containing protein [Tepidisphaeraceae bacterium]|jgi:predicted Zn finger-like uncharacterized protein|nr:zinc-ribbon domain-containing protein [Tepidisphaeraceae bacterium]
MPISVECGGCGKQYRVDDRAAGKKVRCKDCGSTFAVPAAAAPSAGEDDPFESLVKGAFVMCWKVPDGKVVAQFEVPVPIAQGSVPGRGRDWVHNGSALLVLGTAVVDANTGRLLAALNPPPITGQWATGGDTVALTYEQDGKPRVAGVRFDFGKLPATAPTTNRTP